MAACVHAEVFHVCMLYIAAILDSMEQVERYLMSACHKDSLRECCLE